MAKAFATKRITLNGKTLTVYSVSHLAARIHRRPATVRVWQWRKMIPPPIIKTLDGNRWYLEEELEIYVRIVGECEVKSGSSMEKSGFRQRIWSEIEKLKQRLTNPKDHDERQAKPTRSNRYTQPVIEAKQ